MGKDRWSMNLKTMYAEPKLGGFGMSMETIAEKLDKDNRTINRWLKQLEAEGVLKTRPARTPRSIGRLTPHKWLERKELERLTDGTYAMVDHVYAFPELCYIIGFTIGDGFVFYGRSRRDKTTKRERGIVLLNTDFELLNPMLLSAEKVAQRFGVKLTLKYYDRERREAPREKAYRWNMYIWSTPLARIISIKKGHLLEETIDLLLTEGFIGHFLAGLWDADGGVYLRPKKYTRADLVQNKANLPLLRKIRKALTKLGIAPSKPHIRTRKGATVEICGKVVETREDTYAIEIYGADMPTWIKLVGEKMQHPKKIRTIIKIKELS